MTLKDLLFNITRVKTIQMKYCVGADEIPTILDENVASLHAKHQEHLSTRKHKLRRLLFRKEYFCDCSFKKNNSQIALLGGVCFLQHYNPSGLVF